MRGFQSLQVRRDPGLKSQELGQQLLSSGGLRLGVRGGRWAIFYLAFLDYTGITLLVTLLKLD